MWLFQRYHGSASMLWQRVGTRSVNGACWLTLEDAGHGVVAVGWLQFETDAGEQEGSKRRAMQGGSW
jgi:hypothetical protein